MSRALRAKNGHTPAELIVPSHNEHNLFTDLKSRTRLFNGLTRSTDARKVEREGIFYTPSNIAHQMVKQAFKSNLNGTSLASLESLRILDPACGAGVFLLEVFLILIEHLKELGADSLQNRVNLVHKSIFGIDKDSSALSIAKGLISAAVIGESFLENPPTFDLDRNFSQANSLFDDPHENCSGLAASSKYDFIFGNPPYGLSRGNKISQSEKRKLKLAYGAQSKGKINKYLLFIVKGMQLLRKGGVLSYIVPNSWLGIQDGYAVRKLLFESGALQRLDIFHYRVFPGLGVETVILQAVKDAGLSCFEVNHYYSSDDANPRESFSIPYSLWRQSSLLQIPLRWRPTQSSLSEEIERDCFLLGADNSPFAPRIALQAYALGKGQPPQTKLQVKEHAFHSEYRESETYMKYLEGRDVRRYSYSWSGRYLNYGEWLAEPQTIERFTGPRIIIREILAKSPYALVASFIEETALYNKSVLHILPKVPVERESLLALIAILNSSLADRLIAIFGRKSQRGLFPKIVNSDLKNFPLPHLFSQYTSGLASLTKEMTEICSLEDSFSVNRKAKLLQQRIDEDVRRLYGLEYSQIK